MWNSPISKYCHGEPGHEKSVMNAYLEPAYIPDFY